jgi:hypothetical protein
VEQKRTVEWNQMLSNVWNRIVSWVRQESAAATAMVQAFIALGIAFAWWHWSTAQTGAVIGITAAMLGMFVRSQVTPNVRVNQRGQVPVLATQARPADPGVRPAARPPAGPPGPAARPPAGPGNELPPEPDTRAF